MSPNPRDDVTLRMALDLTHRVRYDPPGHVNAILTKLDPKTSRALIVTLAGLVPDDCTPSQLQQWRTADHARRRARRKHNARRPDGPCGTAAGYRRHITDGELPDDACQQAHDHFYQRESFRSDCSPRNGKKGARA